MLVDPESGRPSILNRAERRFLRKAFQLTAEGRLRHPELVYSAPKKSGKTGFAAMIVIFVVLVLGGRFAEGYLVANDFEQAKGRVFEAIRRIVASSPVLAADADIGANRIEFRSSGSTITAIASDYAGAAGANPSISCFDELWAYASERSHRLWDEMVPSPTRKISCRLTVTYAGFEADDAGPLLALYKTGLAGEQIEPDLYLQPGLLMLWTHDFVAPWQDEAWREQMRKQLRPNAYLRLIENRWVSGGETFVTTEVWDACVDQTVTPVVSNPGLSVWVGIDASTKHDSTAVVACAWDAAAKKVRLVAHRIFQPSPDDPLDFESTVEATVLELMRRFAVVSVKYDPYQMLAVAQRLMRAGAPMHEFPQTVGNLTEASSNLYELIRGRNLIVYPNDAVRLAVQRSVVVETSRGWRIAKEKASAKIDVVVALAQAALGAVQGGQAAITEFPELYISAGPTGMNSSHFDAETGRPYHGDVWGPIRGSFDPVW